MLIISIIFQILAGVIVLVGIPASYLIEETKPFFIGFLAILLLEFLTVVCCAIDEILIQTNLLQSILVRLL